MVVIIKEQQNDVYTKTMKKFKRKGIRYYLFIFSLKIFNIEYEVVKNEVI